MRNLTRHKLRVLLTILSLICGVSSVIAMLAIAEGASFEARRQFAALGATSVSIHSMKPADQVNPFQQQSEATQRTFKLVLGSIAGISLLVGGIGIMSLMLATVSERAREIGIRRAVGAKRRDIIEQFLIETTVMSSVGGLIGVVVGVAVPPLFSQLSGVPVAIRPWSAIIAFMIAVSIGVISGVYPAWRAAMLDPVEALREE
jgi:putative ABC transport system permease protein